jgi:hypothetical protein
VKKKKPIPPPVTKQRVLNVGVSALARETGFSAGAVSVKLRQGFTPDDIRRQAAQRQGRVHQSQSTGMGTEPRTKAEYELLIESRSRGEQIEEAKLRRAKALAEKQELDNMLRRGELLPIPYVRLWATRFLIDGRDEMLKGPSEYADALAAETDPVKVNAIMRAWIDRVMAKFEQLKQLWEGDLDAEKVA